MKTIKTITTLAIASLVATSATFALDANQPETRREFKQERKEDMKEVQGKIIEARDRFQADMKAKRDFLKATTTPGNATPTPWKNMRENMKEIKKDFHDERREDRKEFGLQPKPLNATATAAIAAKLGITPENLQAQLASGTKLREIIKDKISPEEMKQILPPRVATFTKVIEERGFFGNIRTKLFGPKQEIVEHKVDEFDQITEAPSKEKVPTPFWKKFFGF